MLGDNETRDLDPMALSPNRFHGNSSDLVEFDCPLYRIYCLHYLYSKPIYDARWRYFIPEVVNKTIMIEMKTYSPYRLHLALKS